ncbi:unnamed protein product, partial [marine sediment metagenome]
YRYLHNLKLRIIINSILSLLLAYTAVKISGILSDEKIKNMAKSIMKEVVLVGKAESVDFEQDMVEKTIQKAHNFPYETKTSFQRDYEKGKTRHEGDIFGGTLIRLAKENNILIPTITKVYKELMSR